MSPRPRKASDEAVYAAVQRAMSRVGPAQMTLADIATEAGITAGALVQRFGSKRELLLRLAAESPKIPRMMFGELRAKNESPLAALREYVACFGAMGETPGGLAHHLSYLQQDLTDPDFHRYTKEMALATDEEMGNLLREAVKVGELPRGADVQEMVRAIGVTISGSLMQWAFYREGTAAAWMLDDLERVLRTYGAKVPRRRR
jgi:AcrR family transcriptional regulator